MLFDIIGMIGVTMILVVYALVHMDRMDVKRVAYSVINALGAGLILISLTQDFNLSAATIEVAWVAISFYGIFAALKRGKS